MLVFYKKCKKSNNDIYFKVYDEERRKIAEEGFEQDGLPLRDKILLVQKSQPRRAARKEI